ncbi:phosphoketolase family protein [Chondrinema litorale]|uniref:phosphoketolase family protein n=1 Tax=Chondrinema litorale TaxID=2994555 RepID=UPI00254351A8|nr:phosphoketolase family protein [Chondrinema litorale]UZR98488.1 phosphoketolase family protein [Chondrinema litorale]
MNSTETTLETTIPIDKLQLLHKYWQSSNYMGAAQIYLNENVMLKKPLEVAHIKPRLLAHWGTVPGLNFIYTHLNRLIIDTNADVLLVVGPGHGAAAINAQLFLENTFGEFYPEYQQNEKGMNKLAHDFTRPYGLPSHIFAGTPGHIHEGGELGYSLSHAFGAALDNPELIVTCIVGDGEAETGPLAASWHSNNFLNPKTDGAVLPILHLNGYKIASPTVLARMSHSSLTKLFEGYGYQVRIVSGSNAENVHNQMWQTIDWAHNEIRSIQENARNGHQSNMVNWPMIILETPKGWTGPEKVDGKQIEGTFNAHQIPLSGFKDNTEHLKKLENWLKSYEPEKLFDNSGKLLQELQKLVPKKDKRIGMNPHANGGKVLKPLSLPNIENYAVEVAEHGSSLTKGTQVLGSYFKDIFKENDSNKNFRIVCPDELDSNKLQDVLEITDRVWQEDIIQTDEGLAKNGRVMEVLSEHNCEGWLEGYLLTGRHGIYACYEAFVPIIDSMMNQYAKWLKESKETSWRAPIASLNYLLTSHVWRQDHNGYSHQVPSFMNNLVTKKKSVARIYLPADANCLLHITERCLKSRDLINLIVANKAPQRQWLDFENAKEHCDNGAGIWEWAGNCENEEPDIVLACAGDVPTTEAVRASQLIQEKMPSVKVRIVNVVDLFALLHQQDYPGGLTEKKFKKLFTEDKPVVFAFHGYPNLVHELLHHRPQPERFHVHGYIEEGSTTTPFDLLVANELSRFHLVLNALKRLNLTNKQANSLKKYCSEKLNKHHQYVIKHGDDMQEILSDMN